MVGPKVIPASPNGVSPPDPMPVAGISEVRQGPFSPMEFTVRNSWIGPQGSSWLFVYAGGGRVNPGEGPAVVPGLRIFVMSRDAEGHDHEAAAGTYLDRSADSALTVTSVTASLMTLRTDTGQVVRFDLRARRFQ
ncbi:MAG: hypothetical protein ACREPA_09190 [Candidatus Dormibacteraceae bacterium]